jgi:adenosylcobinamide-GDP ribazoletransferase
VRDAVRLALGTLTILPVRPPSRVDARTGARAMVLAPLVGLLLGVLVVALLWLVGGGSLYTVGSDGSFSFLADDSVREAPHVSSLSPLLAAALSVAALAFLTRGMHLDGLADTADGLGSGKPAQDALRVMRAGDVGPFGVLTVVLMLLVQVAALEASFARHSGPMNLIVALVLSRAVLPLLCSRGVPPARSDGLGPGVAGSVSRRALALALVVALLAVGVTVALASANLTPEGPLLAGEITLHESAVWSVLRPLLVVVAPLAAAAALAWRCVRRLGGVTGDVLGAGVEVAFTVCLVLLTLG